jgi:hypothetical protein
MNPEHRSKYFFLRNKSFNSFHKAHYVLHEWLYLCWVNALDVTSLLCCLGWDAAKTWVTKSLIHFWTTYTNFLIGWLDGNIAGSWRLADYWNCSILTFLAQSRSLNIFSNGTHHNFLHPPFIVTLKCNFEKFINHRCRYLSNLSWLEIATDMERRRQ